MAWLKSLVFHGFAKIFDRNTQHIGVKELDRLIWSLPSPTQCQ
jgi:hypothetical protein